VNKMDRQQFYKSDAWEKFRQIVIAERTDEDGFVHCAVCGQPILKKYDLIVHHKIELDDLNCNDSSVALNSLNVECVHFKCHNKIHQRFGYHTSSAGYKPVQKKVYIVYGSPCSGKTTWVHTNANESDLIVDLDNIWQMISINERYVKPNQLRSVVFDLRDKIYDLIKFRSGKWTNAYIITGGALKGDRERLMKRVGADTCIFIDTDKPTCIERIQSKGLTDEQKVEWLKYIEDWFDRYQSD